MPSKFAVLALLGCLGPWPFLAPVAVAAESGMEPFGLRKVAVALTADEAPRAMDGKRCPFVSVGLFVHAEELLVSVRDPCLAKGFVSNLRFHGAIVLADGSVKNEQGRTVAALDREFFGRASRCGSGDRCWSVAEAMAWAQGSIAECEGASSVERAATDAGGRLWVYVRYPRCSLLTQDVLVINLKARRIWSLATGMERSPAAGPRAGELIGRFGQRTPGGAMRWWGPAMGSSAAEPCTRVDPLHWVRIRSIL